jgi:homoserine kinase type II
VTSHAGKPAALYPFVEGSWICQSRVDAQRLERVGAAVARIHRAGSHYPGAPEDRFGPQALGERLAGVHAQADELPEHLRAALPSLEQTLSDAALRCADHPVIGVIHGDVFRDNVLWHEGQLSAVLDFESASRGSAAFDLMVTMLAWCYAERLDQPLARALVRGYERERVLAPAEARGLYDAARAAAVRFAITRVTDYELRPRGVVVYKDYRRFVARLAAVESIGRSAWTGWLGLS